MATNRAITSHTSSPTRARRIRRRSRCGTCWRPCTTINRMDWRVRKIVARCPPGMSLARWDSIAVDPVSGNYVFGTPLFDRAVIDLGHKTSTFSRSSSTANRIGRCGLAMRILRTVPQSYSRWAASRINSLALKKVLRRHCVPAESFLAELAAHGIEIDQQLVREMRNGQASRMHSTA